MDYTLDIRGQATVLAVTPTEDGGFEAATPQHRHAVTCRRIDAHHLLVTVDGVGRNVFVSGDAATKLVVIDGTVYAVADGNALSRSAAPAASTLSPPGDVTPPMPAVVVKILVAAGQQVREGDTLVVVAAMKMETRLAAPFDARVVRVNAAVGDKVMPGDILVDLEAGDSGAAAEVSEKPSTGNAAANGRPS